MYLESTLERAIDLTGRHEAAIRAGDMGLCRDLLEIRGEVMAAFEHTYRGSSEAERSSCQANLDKLKSVDAQLQGKCGESLETSAKDLRRAITSGSGTPVGAYKSQVSTGCLDRKA